MLREHRNREDTRRYLGNPNPISAEAQLAWFRSGGSQWHFIATAAVVDTDRFGVMTHRLADVGLARVRVDPATSSAEVGCDVFSGYRFRGLGHKVFAAACRKAEEHGAVRLTLQVFLENEPAVRIYHRAGFREVPDHPVEVYCRDGKILHYVAMQREAGRG